MQRRNTIVAAALAMGIAANAHAQPLQIVDNLPGAFIDISQTGGTPLNLGDDEEVGIGTFAGNLVFLAGTVVVGNNGGIGFGNPTISDLTPFNEPIPSGNAFDGGQAASPTVTNCSFSGNTASFAGGGMFGNVPANPTVTNTGFCDNTPDAIDGTINDGGGNSLLYCPPPIPKPDPCPTDINGDGVTNVLDLIDLLLAFGQACP